MKIFTTIFTIFIFAISCFLLMIGRIGAKSFCMISALSLFVFFGLYLGRRLKEIDFKNLKLILNQIDEAKLDLLITREEIRSLVEDIAAITLSLAVEQSKNTANRDDESQEYASVESIIAKECKRFELKTKIEKMLASAGGTTADIESYSANLRKLSLWNVQQAVKNRAYTLVLQKLYDLFDAGVVERPNSFALDLNDYVSLEKLNALILDPRSRKELNELLESRKLWSDELGELQKQFADYLDQVQK